MVWRNRIQNNNFIRLSSSLSFYILDAVFLVSVENYVDFITVAPSVDDYFNQATARSLNIFTGGSSSLNVFF
jgi:hypothetical protein